jgi:hypothetical protein
MTLWAEKRDVSNAEWGRVQQLFEKHFMAAKGLREMMLICEEGRPGSDKVRLIVALPDGTPVALYDGFAEIDADQVPRAATLLVGYPERFGEQFAYPTRPKPR